MRGTRSRWLSKICCFWYNCKFHAAWEVLASSLSIFGQYGFLKKYRLLSKVKSLLDTSVRHWKNQALYWTEVAENKIGIEILFNCVSQWKSTRLFDEWSDFGHFRHRFGHRRLWLVGERLQKFRWFVFFVVPTNFYCRATCVVSTKPSNFQFSLLLWNVRHLTIRLSLFAGKKILSVFSIDEM